MPWSIDARIPVTLAADAPPREGQPFAALIGEGGIPPAGAVAVESFGAEPDHAAGCACCAGRPAIAIALDRLFLARVRNTVPWFGRVVAVADDAAAQARIVAALRDDAVSAARFRLG